MAAMGTNCWNFGMIPNAWVPWGVWGVETVGEGRVANPESGRCSCVVPCPVTIGSTCMGAGAGQGEEGQRDYAVAMGICQSQAECMWYVLFADGWCYKKLKTFTNETRHKYGPQKCH